MTIRIGELELGKIPRIAVPIDDTFSLQQASEAREKGMDLIELRIDRFSRVDREPIVPFVKRFSRYPTLATVRSMREGGGAELSEDERLAIFEAVFPEVGAVDIELSAKDLLPRVVELGKSQKKPVIGSFHDFERTPQPSELDGILREGQDSGVDIVKIATHCTTQGDVRALARFLLDHPDVSLIVVGMGALGSLTRILFPALGSLLTYSFLEESIAPGQLSLEETRRLFEVFNLRPANK